MAISAYPAWNMTPIDKSKQRAVGSYSCLSGEDKEIMDTVIRRFGKATTDEIVCAMHKEDAFTKTEPRNIIEFKHAKNLSLR